MSTAPAIVCLKSPYNNKFLRYNGVDTTKMGFWSANPFDEGARFEVIHARRECGLSGFIHLRNCFSKKFLECPDQDKDTLWITATGENPNEEIQDTESTLFKPTIIESFDLDKKNVILRMVVYAQDACFSSVDETLVVDRTSSNVIQIIDYPSVSTLPTLSAFKCDNGHWLAPVSVNGKWYLQFSADKDDNEKTVNYVTENNDGTISLKSVEARMPWRVESDGSVVAQGPVDSRNGEFTYEYVDFATVALKSKLNNRYLKRYSGGPHGNNMLYASGDAIDEFSLFTVT